MWEYTQVVLWILVGCLVGLFVCTLFASSKVTELKAEVTELDAEIERQKNIALGYATRNNDLETELSQRKIDMKA